MGLTAGVATMRSNAARCSLTLGLAGAAVLGFATGRALADEPPGGPQWTGFYIGGQVGGAGSDVDWRYQNANYFNTLGPVVVGSTFDQAPGGIIGGVHGGYNYQAGVWVFGLELTASAADMKERRPSPFFPALDVNTTDVSWLTAATGRLGLACGPWLVFAKGGWAAGKVRLTLVDQTGGVFGAGREWANGWTVGGGAEYMFRDGVSLGITYDYVALGIDGKTVTCPGCVGVGAGFGVPIVDADVKVQSVVARLTFHQ